MQRNNLEQDARLSDEIKKDQALSKIELDETGTDLYLSGIDLTLTSINILCDFLKSNPQITDLSLISCGLGDKEAIKLSRINTLKYLHLSGNNITNVGAKMLALNNSITDLNLDSNDISAAVTDSFLANDTLVDLTLGDADEVFMPDELKESLTTNKGFVAEFEQETQDLETLREETKEQHSGFYCPITKKIMHDPFLAENGLIYEREVCNRSGLPNTALKLEIEKYLSQHTKLKCNDQYISYSAKKDITDALEKNQADLLEKLLAGNIRFAIEPLILPTTESLPVYLLQLACDYANEACLKVVIDLLQGNVTENACSQKISLTALEFLAKCLPGYQAVKLLHNFPEDLSQDALYRIAVKFIKDKDLPALDLLILHGLNLHCVDSDKDTLLHVAARYDSTEIATWLLTKDINLEKAINNKNQRPRDVASVVRNTELAHQITEQYQLLKLDALMTKANQLRASGVGFFAEQFKAPESEPAAASSAAPKPGN